MGIAYQVHLFLGHFTQLRTASIEGVLLVGLGTGL
jgi:hypothetical protein